MAINITGKLYATTEEGIVCEAGQVEGLDTELSKKQDKLTAGNGIEITNEGVINVTQASENIVLKKNTNLLYEIKYNALDYDFAKKYFEEKYVPLDGACSVVRKGNKIGRNLDWYYDNEIEFIVESEQGLGRHAVKGFVGTISSLTKEYIEGNNINNNLLKILPFVLLDGINDNGLMCSVNIVNQNATKSISDNGTIPLIEERDKICLTMAVRYILDNFNTVNEACDYIKNYVKVFPPILDGKKVEAQIFIADRTTSKILSFENNKIVVIEEEFHGVLTNFRLSDTVLINNEYKINGSNIEDLGSGIERANIALNLLNNHEVENIMESLKYTNTYKENSNWYSEFVGINDTTIHSDIQIFKEIQSNARNLYLDVVTNKNRNNKNIWHTTHTIIYDLDTISAKYFTQEINDGNSFSGLFNIDYIENITNKEIDLILEEIIKF